VHVDAAIPLLWEIAVVGTLEKRAPVKSTLRTFSGPVHKNSPHPPNHPNQEELGDLNKKYESVLQLEHVTSVLYVPDVASDAEGWVAIIMLFEQSERFVSV